jgi:hypothetical protein
MIIAEAKTGPWLQCFLPQAALGSFREFCDLLQKLSEHGWGWKAA